MLAPSATEVLVPVNGVKAARGRLPLSSGSLLISYGAFDASSLTPVTRSLIECLAESLQMMTCPFLSWHYSMYIVQYIDQLYNDIFSELMMAIIE